MRSLYPACQPFVQHSLPVGDEHVLHVAEYGRAEGVPAILLHGGPGAGYAPWHPRLFNPELFRLVVFDQRGCGRSVPHGTTAANTTWHLVDDIEHIRMHLGIERWLVFGGSWGATLALAYAEAHAERVSAMILRGVALCRPCDVAWFYQAGAHRILPDYWADFVAPIPLAERDDLLAAYHRRLFGSDDIARMSAAKAWALWEGRASTLLPDPRTADHFSDAGFALALARIECHYFANGCWLEADQLLGHADRLADIPGTIVHGRYDLVCPVDQADQLARVWPRAEYQIIPDAGHSAREPGTVDALVRATDRHGAMLTGAVP